MVQLNDRQGLEMAGPTRLELATSGVTGLDSVPLFSTVYVNYQQLTNDSG